MFSRSIPTESRKKRYCQVTHIIILLLALACCHVVIRGAIIPPGAQNQRPGDIVTSALNCGRLGGRPDVKHFNWMSLQIWNGDLGTDCPVNLYFTKTPLKVKLGQGAETSSDFRASGLIFMQHPEELLLQVRSDDGRCKTMNREEPKLLKLPLLAGCNISHKALMTLKMGHELNLRL